MNNIKKIIKKYNLVPHRYTIKNKVTIVNTEEKSLVIKEASNTDINYLYQYLKSRNFEYFPKLLDREGRYNVYEFVEEVKTPNEQKATDIIHLLSLLHNKTTYYKEIDLDEYKIIYESTIDKLEYLYNYYNDIITVIEGNIYMSPSEYLLARNISKLYEALSFGRREIDLWYDLIKEKQKMRIVTIHNNIDVDHLLRNNNLYLVSWDKATRDSPIYDFYIFYKKKALDYDFTELLKLYESKYPLLDDERKLLFILLAMPERIDFNNNEYNNCKNIRKAVEYIYKTEQLIKPYYTIQNKK